MKRILILIIYTSSQLALAGDLKYPVSAISDDLKMNVNVVIREDKSVFTIYSKNKASYYAISAITILNEKGNSYAENVIWYDRLRKITKLNGAVYDASGKLIKKLKNSEIRDQSAFDGFSLFSDDRLKFMDLSQNTYPYTVEYEYEVEYKYLYSIDGSVIIPAEKISVQHSSYELIYPSSLRPRTKTLNIPNEKPVINKRPDGTETMIWTFENLKPIKFEPYGPSHKRLTPRILAAPNEFEYEGYIGDMNSWDDFGKWVASLNKGRDVLPETAKSKIREITKGLNTTEEKSKAVYEFLQNKSRYVSIQIGIGGYQPFEASVVDQTGYGDCKALSNYAIALLGEVGVKANYVLINAGEVEKSVEEDFPNSAFNHATVCIPNVKDTIWLECTSQTAPFGYQGKFTGDRKALMITENGGKIVNTLRYSAEQNRQSCSADVTINVNGSAKAKAKTVYSGLQYENDNLDFIVDRSYDDQKNWILKNTDIPSFDVVSFTMSSKKDKIPAATVTLDLSLNRFATVSGKRLFMTPNLMNRISFIPEKVEDRKTDVYRKNAYTHLDTIRYNLPEELYPEFLPETINIQSRFGEYHATFTLDQGKVVYTRKVVMKKGVFPPDSYNELIDFFKKISKADNTKLVFLNKT